MPITLPKPIADYYVADGRDGAATARCFTQDAVVVDERRTHVGRAAIAAWKTEAANTYRYACEPIAVADEGDRILVSGRVSGDFPGSPIDLRYAFVLDGDLIARLEIMP